MRVWQRLRYVDGFVLPMPKKNITTYVEMARLGAKVWRDHGAVEYLECVGDDLKVKFGRSFPRAPQLGRSVGQTERSVH
jgi:uncharacterized protein YbaA (DUF1428 family)